MLTVEFRLKQFKRVTPDATTEELKATCQNYPSAEEAFDAAMELERRIGGNSYSARVMNRRKGQVNGHKV